MKRGANREGEREEDFGDGRGKGVAECRQESIDKQTESDSGPMADVTGTDDGGGFQTLWLDE